MTEVHQIRSESKSKDDTILPPSRWLNFTGSVLNRSPRMIQSYHILDDWSYTGSILNQSSRMIQSHHILDDQSLQITLGQVSRDDTIPLQHHYSPFRGRSFWTIPSLSRKCSNFTRDRGFVSASSSKPSSSTSLVCEYWTIIRSPSSASLSWM